MIAALLMLVTTALPQGQPPVPPPPQTPPGATQPAQPPQPMPMPRALAAHRGERAIAVDGSLLDWPGLPPIDLSDQRQVSGTANNAWRGFADLGGAVFLLWDQEALYIAASVSDDWHRALDAGTLQSHEIPAADSIVLTFDPDRNTRSVGPDPGRTEDAEFWLADEASHDLVRWDRLRGTARTAEGGRCVVSHDREQGITSYEAMIPWKEILPVGRRIEGGLVFDLQVVINDFDESTDPMPQTRVGWTFGTGPRIDPGRLAPVMLVADLAALHGAMPEFPPPPKPAGEEVPGAAWWDALAQRLGKVPPAPFTGQGAPGAAGGLERLAVLEEIERQCAAFPRVDFLEWNHRLHRRMTREIAGLAERGLPCFWFRETARVSQRCEVKVPDDVLRVVRLPQGGWLVRSATQSFAVDPAGPDLAMFLWGALDFAILTQPLDMTRRNDQLLLRMLAAQPQRQFLTHIVFHLPMFHMADMRIVEPGGTLGRDGGVTVQALGRKQPDGSVPYAIGYVVTMPGGRRVLVAGVNTEPDEIPAGGFDCCILSARNPRAAEVAAAAGARLVFVDDAFHCQTFAGVPRLTLAAAHALQQAMTGQASILLAPGEHWDVR